MAAAPVSLAAWMIRLLIQITLDTGGRADTNTLIGLIKVQRMAVGLGKHRNGPDPQFFAGPDDPQGDLSPIGDEDLGKHDYPAFKSFRLPV